METRKLENDNRKYVRHLVTGLAAHYRDSDEKLGDVLNLSLGGMLIAHKEAISEGTILNIRITQTDEPNKLSDLVADAQVIWYRQDAISGIFGSGLEFVGNNKKQRSKIQAIIDARAVYGVLHNKTNE